jgi:phage terminase large subunit GpA-like protein
MTSLSKLSATAKRLFKPPPKFKLSEYADTHVRLSSESSAESGKWQTYPYQQGILDALTDPAIEEVWVQKSARVGWTKMLNIHSQYHMHHDPCSILHVQPTLEDAEGYSKEEIAPMLRDTPCLQGLVSDAKAKDGSNSLLQKQFPGGVLSLVGANSPRGFRRVSRRIVQFDEVDGYPPTAGAEGDQIKLGKKRSEYFWNRKIVGGSTPTIKHFSRIERLFTSGDQRRRFLPCPHCKHMQILKWENLKWIPGDYEATTHFVCENEKCKAEIFHHDFEWMDKNGEWRSTAIAINPKVVSFHIWAAYSYSPNSTWPHLAREYDECKSDAEQLKTFVNTVMGEVWEDEFSTKLSAEGLYGKALTTGHLPGIAPAGVLVITAGVDVQDNRIEVTIDGWGVDEECWRISHEVIYGDTEGDEVWAQLDEILYRPIPHEIAEPMPISAMAVDTGYRTHTVYDWARRRKGTVIDGRLVHRVLAVKGDNLGTKPAIGKGKKLDVNWKGQSHKKSVELFIVGSSTVKDAIYPRMAMPGYGAKTVHFHRELTADYFEQLTAEKKIIKYSKMGFPVAHWHKKNGARNEALDCAVYAYAALQWLYTRRARSTFWEQYHRELKLRDPEQESAPAAAVVEEKLPEPVAQGNPYIDSVSGGNWATGFIKKW